MYNDKSHHPHLAQIACFNLLAREREKDISQARRKVAERERSLADAKRKGDAKKIADREAKFETARRELTRAEKPIAQ